MNKCAGHRKYAFPDPCVMVFFQVVICTTNLSQYWTLVFSHYEEVYRTQKVRVSGPKCNNLFFSCCDMYYHLSQYWSLLFSAAMNKCTEVRKYAVPDPCLLDFNVLVGTITSQNIRHFFNTLYVEAFVTECQ